MKAMSRASTREYILRRQEDYLGEPDRFKRGRILDEVCHVTGLERKYASKLLKGTRSYSDRKGRGKTYGKEARKLLVQTWRASGCLCAKYLVEAMDGVLLDLSELQNVVTGVAERVRSMSASTIDRILKGIPRTAKIWSRRNHRLGRNPLRDVIPCESGERIPAHDVPPGDIQVDSVAFCGGILEGDHYWVATSTDRRT